MPMSKGALKAALVRAGFKVKTYSKGDQSNLWSIHGNGIVRNDLRQSEAETILRNHKA